MIAVFNTSLYQARSQWHTIKRTELLYDSADGLLDLIHESGYKKGSCNCKGVVSSTYHDSSLSLGASQSPAFTVQYAYVI